MFFFYLYLTLVEGLTGLMDTLKELTEENKVKSMEIGTLQGRFNEQTSQLREYKDRYAEYKRLGELTDHLAQACPEVPRGSS